MGSVRPEELQKSDIVHIESEINNLWRELNTANIPQAIRQELEGKLSACEEQFTAVLSGQAALKDLAASLGEVDHMLAMAALVHAETVIPKAEHNASAFQALENVTHLLEEGKISPLEARHEIKTIMRPHHS